MSNSIYIRDQWINSRALEGKAKGFLVLIYLGAKSEKIFKDLSLLQRYLAKS